MNITITTPLKLRLNAALLACAAGATPPAPPRRPLPPLTPEAEYLGYIIDELRDLNQVVRQRVAPSGSKAINMRQPEFAQDFCTVRAYAARYAGSTAYILRHAGPDDLVVVATPQLLNDYKRLAPHIRVALATRLDRVEPGPFRTIYVDEPSAVFEMVDRWALYNRLAHIDDQTFILLGG